MRGASGSRSRATSGSSRSRCGKSRSSTVASCSSGTSARPSFSPTTGPTSRGRMVRSHLIRPILHSLQIHRVRRAAVAVVALAIHLRAILPAAERRRWRHWWQRRRWKHRRWWWWLAAWWRWRWRPTAARAAEATRSAQATAARHADCLRRGLRGHQPGRPLVLHPAAADMHGLRERLHRWRACRRRHAARFRAGNTVDPARHRQSRLLRRLRVQERRRSIRAARSLTPPTTARPATRRSRTTTAVAVTSSSRSA